MHHTRSSGGLADLQRVRFDVALIQDHAQGIERDILIEKTLQARAGKIAQYQEGTDGLAGLEVREEHACIGAKENEKLIVVAREATHRNPHRTGDGFLRNPHLQLVRAGTCDRGLDATVRFSLEGHAVSGRIGIEAGSDDLDQLTQGSQNGKEAFRLR